MALTLDVLISTLGYDGINRVVAMNLPEVDNVKYIVSWQLPDVDEFPGEIPEELKREDINVFPINSRGLCVNRNNAIKHSTADLCLVSDDDLIYKREQLEAVIKTFENNQDVDLATFCYSGGDGKWYSDREFDWKQPKRGSYITSFEIAFRRESVDDKVSFNELFGLGEHLFQAGEEGVFLHQALCRGLRCRFFPIVITHHQGLTTGSRQLTPGVLMAEGAQMSIVYPKTALLRIPLFAWRAYRKRQTNMFVAVYYLLKGYIYGNRYLNKDGTIKKMP